MAPLYVAQSTGIFHRFEALETHLCLSVRYAYIFHKDSPMFPSGLSQETLTSNTGVSVQSALRHLFISYRRLRCQRASNYWLHSALSLLLLPVRASSRSKNLSLLTQPLFRLSQHRQANTSNLLTKWASAPTSTLTGFKASPRYDGQLAGGAATC